jgi:hypothetical protein
VNINSERKPIRKGTLKESIISIGSILLAFLASQHHTLHMLLLVFGVGSAEMAFMTTYPLLRRGMLLLALVSAGFTVYQLWRRRQTPFMRVFGGISVALTLGIVIWSILQFGL